MTGWQIDAYTTARRAAGVAPATLRLQARYVQRFATSHPDPDQVDPVDISLWLDQWPAPETRKSALSALRGYYRWQCWLGSATRTLQGV